MCRMLNGGPSGEGNRTRNEEWGWGDSEARHIRARTASAPRFILAPSTPGHPKGVIFWGTSSLLLDIILLSITPR